MIRTSDFEFPDELQDTFKKTKRLEIFTIVYLLSVVVVMYFSLGSSQAMKAAWLEDILSLVPSVVFLISAHFFNKSASSRFPYGYHRVFSVAFLCGSVALFSMGLFLLFDSSIALIKTEHPTIGSVTIFGFTTWMGWLMIAALIYSAVPAMIIGRKKLPLSKKLHNKILHTDAKSQKADWMTALAAIIGIIGIGFGLWWADAAAAIFISLSVLRDGYNSLKDSVTGLMDEIPTKIENSETDPLVYDLLQDIKKEDWVLDASLRLREAGNVFFGEVFIVPRSDVHILNNVERTRKKIMKEKDWRFHDIVVTVVKDLPNK